MSSLYYEEISDVKELEDVNAVNDHIRNGWVLLKIGEKSKSTSDPMTSLPVQEVGVVYILGLKKSTIQHAGIAFNHYETESAKREREQAEKQAPSSAPEPIVSQKEKVEPSTDVPITIEHLGQLPWKASAYGEWIFTDAERHTKPTLSNFQKRIHAWLLQQCPMNQSKTFEGSAYIYQTNKDFITRNQKQENKGG